MNAKVISVIVIGMMLLPFSVLAKHFLPEPNGGDFGLKYAEALAGIPVNAPKIDGDLDDWRHAVWVAYDSDKELLRGKGAWKGKDDLSVTWSVMYDDKTLYFAAAVRDDSFTPSPNPAQPWLGDTIFLYIDWENVGAGQPSSKPNFALLKNKAVVTDFSGGKNPRLGESEIAIVPRAELGKGGMIYEVAMPFEFLTKVKIKEGSEIGFSPGYEEGTDNLEKKAALVFMDWNGLNPDDSANLGTLKFGGPLAVDAGGKLATMWGRLKQAR